MKARIIFCFLFTFLQASLFAQPEKGVSPLPAEALAKAGGATRALVIGISNYQDEAIPDLQFAHRDAITFARYLHSPGGGNLPSENIQLLLNEEATSGQVGAALDWLLSETGAGDSVIIYFSGHGDMEAKVLNQLGFLLLWDAPPHVYYSGGVLSVNMLQQCVSTLSVIKNARVWVILDACRAGKLAGSDIIGPQLANAQLARQWANETKVLSCQSDEFSIEGAQWGGGRGVFSYYLVNGLIGRADTDGDQIVSLLEIEHYLEDHVSPEVAPLTQIPLTVGDKKATMARVDQQLLDSLDTGREFTLPAFEQVVQRGLEQEVLAKADSGILQLYAAYKKSIAEKRLLEPEGNCANFYVEKLLQVKLLAPLYPMLRRNFAAALIDDSQQVTNKLLKTDPKVVSDVGMRPFVFDHIPAQLARAIDLLGEAHYMYKALKAKQLFFEGLTEFSRDGSAQEVEKRFEILRDKLEQALQLDTTAAYVYTYLAYFYLWDFPNREYAIRNAEKALKLAPNWLIANLYTGFIFTVFGVADHDTTSLLKGEAYLLKAFELDSTAIYTNHALSWCYWQYIPNPERHRYYRDKVIASVQELLQSDSQQVTIMERFMLGIELWRAGRLAESATVLEDCARRTHYRRKSIYQYLGLIYNALGQYDDYLRVAKKQIELNPYNTEGYLQLAEACYVLHRPDDVIEYLGKGLVLPQLQVNKAQYVNLLLYLIEAYEKTGREQDAQIQLQLVADQLPDRNRAAMAFEVYVFGKAYILTGDMAGFQRVIDEGLEKIAGEPWMHYPIACLYALAKDEQKALEYLEVALQKKLIGLDWINIDTDWDNIRDSEGFKALLKKYFPGEFKD